MKNILITHAVKEEITPITIKGYNVSYLQTGIGKTKSAMHLTHAIIKNNPDLVINLGTAGTVKHNVGDIFICQRFIDRDFQETMLPGIEHEINSSALLPGHELAAKIISDSTPKGTCNTGDTFVTELGSLDGDVVDMESFAQATVCREFDVPFVAIKYVTDIIGQNSVKHWEDKLSDARNGLAKWFQDRGF